MEIIHTSAGDKAHIETEDENHTQQGHSTKTHFAIRHFRNICEILAKIMSIFEQPKKCLVCVVYQSPLIRGAF